MIKKISIIGAGGVGSNLAFSILNNLKLDELVLVDIDLDRVQAVAYDLEDTRGILNFSTVIKGVNNYSEIKSSEIVVFAAGLPRRQGMSRIDLLKVNSKVAKKAALEIRKNTPKSIVIAVTNPLDIITYLLLKDTRFQREKVIGMGSSLDTSRLLNILFKETGVSADSHKATVFGPHSKDMLVDLSSNSYFSKNNRQKANKLVNQTRLRGAKIVGLLKDRSAVFAPALACCRLIQAIAFNKNQVIPVSVLLKGEYQLKGVCLGVPCLINREGAVKVIEQKITAAQSRDLKKVSNHFKETLKNIGRVDD